MAASAKQFSWFFLIMLSASCQIQARESKFFSKYLHLSTNTYVTIPSPKVVPPSLSPSPITSQISSIPASAPIEAGSSSAPSPAPMNLGADYSPAPAPTTLHGADYSPAPAPSEDDIPYYGLSGENPEELTSKESYTDSNSLSNNNAFWTTNQESYRNTNNGYEFDGGYKSGMSDTRFLDNGKYYYDVEQDNYNSHEEEYNDSYYKKSKYEFDSMEEYEKQQGYADVHEDFIP